jgi:hypothetical protein
MIFSEICRDPSLVKVVVLVRVRRLVLALDDPAVVIL